MLDEELQLWHLLSDCVDELRDTAVFADGQESSYLSLTAHQLRLMQTVRRLTRNTREGISLKALAEQLRLSSSAASLMVETLVQKDELERLHSSRDRRMVLIRISPRGRLTIDRIEEKFRRLMKEFIDELKFDERDVMVGVLTRLLAKIRQYESCVEHPAT